MTTAEPRQGPDFVVALEGFEGPLDLLLDLARAEKVDLRRISLIALADQYLTYLGRARAAGLELAAEYLIMAAWLAYLKSQLLLPALERDGLDAQDMARQLAARLVCLDSVRRAAGWLDARPRLGIARQPRGAETTLPVCSQPRWVASLSSLLAAYGIMAARATPATMELPARRRATVEGARDRLSRLLTGHDWHDIEACVPSGLCGPLEERMGRCVYFVAGLELARTGAIELRQAAPFGPIMARRRVA